MYNEDFKNSAEKLAYIIFFWCSFDILLLYKYVSACSTHSQSKKRKSVNQFRGCLVENKEDYIQHENQTLTFYNFHKQIF
jgi:hypothetical protein